MKKQNIHQAYDSITLTQGEKDAMLEQILSVSGHRPAERKRTMNYKKTLMIAAVVAAMAIFMGCAVVALTTNQLKLHDNETTSPHTRGDGGNENSPVPPGSTGNTGTTGCKGMV